MKLRTKFGLLISLLVILIVSGVTVSLLISESKFLLDELQKNQAAMIESLSEVAKESRIVKDDIMLINYLKLLKKSKGIVYASVTDTEGTVIAHTDVKYLGEILTDQPSINAKNTNILLTQAYNYNDIDVTDLSMPSLIDGAKKGSVRIGLSKKILDETVKDSLLKAKKRIFLASIIALITGILGALLLTRMMTGPIQRIAAGAQILGKGNLNHKIDVRTKDELGDLACEFNNMAEKLKELDHLKQDFVSSVTHELRSPLLSLKMYIDLFFKGTAGTLSEKQKEYLGVMKDCSLRLSRFIDDLLDVAKIERGKMEVKAEKFNINEAIIETIKLYKPQFDSKNITASFKAEENIPLAVADSDRTRQVLMNLFSNAFKFTLENGNVLIKCSFNNSSKFIEISVKDSGIGIPKEKLSSIFNKFEQVTDAREKTTGAKGTGLGLSIVKGIIELQGGTIKVESERDRGTAFTFTVPTA